MLEILKQLDPSKFNEGQIKQIMKGAYAGLDVSVYAKPELNEHQMKQLRLGLSDGYDVTPYVDNKFTAAQLSNIIHGLDEGIDVSIYARHDISADKMMRLRHIANIGLDICKYTESSVKELDRVYMLNIIPQMEPYLTGEFDDNQIELIKSGILREIDVRLYAKKEFEAGRMFLILEALQRKLSNHTIELLSDTTLSYDCISEIFEAALDGIDISEYLDRFNPKQLREIHVGISDGLDVSKYANPSISAKSMRLMRRALDKKLDVGSLLDPSLNEFEIQYIYHNMVDGNKSRKKIDKKNKKKKENKAIAEINQLAMNKVF